KPRGRPGCDAAVATMDAARGITGVDRTGGRMSQPPNPGDFRAVKQRRKATGQEPVMSSDKGADRSRTGVRARSPNGQQTRGLYFIQDEAGPIKIGVADDAVARLRSLQGGNPRELLLLAYVPDAPDGLERELHLRLIDRRMRGEWFEDCQEVRDVIEEV